MPGNKGFQHCESGEPWRLPASKQGAQGPMFSPFMAELPEAALPAASELRFPGFLIPL